MAVVDAGNLVVRAFHPDDADELATLLIEMATFYGAVVDPLLDIATDVVRRAGEMDILVATCGGHLVGFAAFTSLYPLGRLTSFTYLHQIYVAAAARRSGVARRLLLAVAAAAVGRGSARLEWTTAADNHPARALYESLGAIGTDKRCYALDEGALSALAASPAP